jgi:arginyl-tRNA synthetase
MNLIKFLNVLKAPHSPVKDYTWTIPPDLSMGVLTTNQAFLEAKKQGRNPKDIAEEIKTELVKFLETEGLSHKYEVKTVGPYVNIDLTDLGLLEFSQTQDQFELEKMSDRVLIDYFSPNVGKKMHVGHIRSADIGESLRRILSLKYETVISNNHLGDWGIQFGMLVWGLRNLDLKDYIKESSYDYYSIYVKVNSLSDADENIKKECQTYARILENFASCDDLDQKDHDLIVDIFSKYHTVIASSTKKYWEATEYLNLNKVMQSGNSLGLSDFTELDSENSGIPIEHEYLFTDKYKKSLGLHSINETHKANEFDLTIGESYYIKYLPVFEELVTVGIAAREGQAIYVDLEDKGLGRCYLISSEGYSLYHSRDIIARFVWAGLLGADKMLSLADNRQSHSFKQVFAIIKKILDSGLYEVKSDSKFGLLTPEETKNAISIQKKQMPEHIGFGFMTLPDGAMSTRKGKIVAFDDLKNILEQKVGEVLSQKSGSADPELIRKVSVASLKWVDLFRDRDQDIIFDFGQFLNFEGNTGVYQLYTLARINSILKKHRSQNDAQDTTIGSRLQIDISTLNLEEKLIIKEIYTLPYILDNICHNYKPHQLCNHLFELTSKINSWYAKFSVAAELDLARQESLLGLCCLIKNHLSKGLELLGIEPVDQL